MSKSSRDHVRGISAAINARYRLILCLVPLLRRQPRSQKFLLGDRIQARINSIATSSITLPDVSKA